MGARMDVKVNKSEWESLSQENRDRINSIISSHFQGSTVVGADGVNSSHDIIQAQKFGWNPGKPFCTAACGVAEAAAVAACSALSGGVAVAACVAAAHVAGDYCRSRC